MTTTETQPQYTHGEAFCLMRYVSDDGTEQEVIWNSRDGVTPFIITLRSGKQATHAGPWDKDPRVLNYRPTIGERIFVDLDRETANRLATERVEEWWDHPEYPMSRRWETKAEAVAVLVPDYYGDGHQPYLAEVVAR